MDLYCLALYPLDTLHKCLLDKQECKLLMSENVSYYSLFPHVNWNELFLEIGPRNIYAGFTDSVATVQLTLQQVLEYSPISVQQSYNFAYLDFDYV